MSTVAVFDGGWCVAVIVGITIVIGFHVSVWWLDAREQRRRNGS